MKTGPLSIRLDKVRIAKFEALCMLNKGF